MPIDARCCSQSPASSHFAIGATDASVIFELNAWRLKEPGIETCCIDLRCQHFAVPVVRVTAPGTQPEPSDRHGEIAAYRCANRRRGNLYRRRRFDIDWRQFQPGTEILGCEAAQVP